MPSDLGRKFTLTEVDRSRLKLAREAQDFSHKQLAAKLCLSHSYIAQLEENQLTVFFTHVHKVQVATKVGAALGLKEDEYLIHKTTNAEYGASKSGVFADASLNHVSKLELFSIAKKISSPT